MTRPHDILTKCAELIEDRGQDYGGIEDNFRRISVIASVILNKTITPHDAAIVHLSTKLARMAGAQNKEDNYLDGINYLAFAAELRKLEDTNK
jgi:hypothetical protein